MQAFALVGCLVTGTLARRRRLEVEGLNNRLRQINAELMKRGTVEVPHPPAMLVEDPHAKPLNWLKAHAWHAMGVICPTLVRDPAYHLQCPELTLNRTQTSRAYCMWLCSDAEWTRPAAQELVCAADADKEAVLAYRAALEQALDQPAAAHPVESYGVDNMSLTQVRNLGHLTLQEMFILLRSYERAKSGYFLACRECLSC